MSSRRKGAWLSAAVAALAVAVVATFLVISAGPAKAKQFATIDILAGDVDLSRGGQQTFQDARDGDTLREGDVVRTGDDGRAEIEYFDGSRTRLDFDTTFTIEELSTIPDRPGSKVILGAQESGRTFNRITKLTGSQSRVDVATPTAVASVRGTIFFTQEILEADGTISWLIGVLDGAVLVTPEGGGEPVLVEAGSYVVADSNGNLGPVLPLTDELLNQDWILFNQCDLDGVQLDACEVDEGEDGDQDGEEPSPEDTLSPDPTPTEDPAPTDDPIPPDDTTTPTATGGNPPAPPPPPPGDTDPPNTSITAGPPALSGSSSGQFAFASTESGSSFECRFDGASFSSCSSPQGFTLGDGDHTFRVRATDGSGNTDPSPATYDWEIDTTAPQTSITGGPSSPVNATSATFAFASSEVPSSFQCSMDGAGFQACSSGDEFTGLSEGDHTFAVRAMDAVGNVDPSPAEHQWTIDVTPPQTTIGSGPASPTNDPDATFTFGANEPVQSFECDLDGDGYEVCQSPRAYQDLPDGAHTFSVRATDLAGNVENTAVWTWTIDTVAPVVTIESGPEGTVGSTEAEFGFSSEPGATFHCSLDGAAAEACVSPAVYDGLGEGTHTFSVTATDEAGNISAPADRAWAVDTTGPTTTILTGPEGPTADDTASFTFSSEPGATFTCDLTGDEDGPQACDSGEVTYPPLADGEYTFSVFATDAVGNDGPEVTREFSVDTTGPATTILTGPEGPTADDTATFTFSSEPGATFTCDLTGDEEGPQACDSGEAIYGPLADGDYTFSVFATDSLGNPGSEATQDFTVDTTGPQGQVVIDAGPDDPTNQTSATFEFHLDEGGGGGEVGALASEDPAGFQCQLDGEGFEPCGSGVTYGSDQDPLEEDTHTFEVRAVDELGNPGPVTEHSWEIDLTAPVVTIDGPPSPDTVGSGEIDFSADEAATFSCTLDEGPAGPCEPPVPYDLDDGDHTFTVVATDLAGNDSAPAIHTWTVDTATSVTITGGPADGSTTNQTSATFTFAAEEGTSVECRLQGTESDTGFTSCDSTTEHSYPELADDTYTFTVRATDPAGNTATASRTWTVEAADTEPPDTEITDGPLEQTESTSATFEFTSTEENSTFQCSLDGAAAEECTSPWTYEELGLGPHTFQVWAIDPAGNPDPEAAVWSWRIGGTGTEIAINLTWSNGPRDLDVHVNTPDGAHVYYGNLSHPDSGEPWATLDHDITNGPPGSETITLYPGNEGFVEGTFTVYVHNYSCERPFTTSGATVTVSGGGTTTSLAISGAAGNPTFDTWNVGTVTVGSDGTATVGATQTVSGDRECPAGGDQEIGAAASGDGSRERTIASASIEEEPVVTSGDESSEVPVEPAITAVEAEVQGSAMAVRWQPVDSAALVLWSTEEFPLVVGDNVACRGVGECRITDLPAGSTVYLTVLARAQMDQAPQAGVNAVRVELPAEEDPATPPASSGGSDGSGTGHGGSGTSGGGSSEGSGSGGPGTSPSPSPPPAPESSPPAEPPPSPGPEESTPPPEQEAVADEGSDASSGE